MATRKSNDSDCNSVSFLKYVLHIFNAVFLLSGVAVLGVGIWTVADKQRYVSLLTNATFELAAWVLVVAGCLVLAVTVVGCLSVLRENRMLLLVYKCCGANLFEDWKYSRWLKENPSVELKVPDSCCKTILPNCGRRDHPNNIHYTGCRHRLADEVRDHLIILSAVGLGICVLQIFGMIFSCCLYIKLKDVVD
ncbi:Tetraspanin-11 [Blattella germanica]|nr:Tetraspanin-11 [Blattella germanica]